MDACPYNAIHGVQWNIDALSENMLDFHFAIASEAKARFYGRKKQLRTLPGLPARRSGGKRSTPDKK
jgi:hypothetical protein